MPVIFLRILQSFKNVQIVAAELGNYENGLQLIAADHTNNMQSIHSKVYPNIEF